jgi:pimeloyl-ACP methyl ester carboxylesterase
MQVKEPSFVTIDGRKMAYDEVKPANPKGTVLLLTGLASKRLGWYKQLEEFGRYYHTIALDHRDVGDSDEVQDAYTTGDQAEDAAAVLKALGISKAHVVGISMGGFIALELTLRHSEMVDKLVLTSTSAGGETHVAPGPEMLMRLAQRDFETEVGEAARQTYTLIMGPGYAAGHPEEMEHVAEVARYRPMSPAAYYRQLQACMGHNASQRLGQIKVPTLVVHGDTDPLVPTENGHFLAKNIEGAKLVLYPQTGHIPIIEKAEEYNRDVLAFLES